MSDPIQISFAPIEEALDPTVVLLVGPRMSFGAYGRDLDDASGGQLKQASDIADFSGKANSSVELLAPSEITTERVILAGLGDIGRTREAWMNLGGRVAARLTAAKVGSADVIMQGPDGNIDDKLCAAFAAGAMLRRYRFDKYKTKSGKSGASNAKAKPRSLTIKCEDPDGAEAAFRELGGVARGVLFARDLVNEPANHLGPEQFAERIQTLGDLDVDVEILDVPALEKEKMGALLAVGQGSVRPSRVAVMRWRGGKSKRTRPIAFVGKGVVFDTGGISIKPARGMEDMKGDMGGAACVAGLMHALAAREAKVNAVGIVGLVENMPDGAAQRPGDIVTSKSGQTIEVLNTDAEGRLVLADLLTYARERFKPKAMINLATLTGAIIVALGKEHAGLFSNNDRLAGWLGEAGTATGEKVWRMPLDEVYDKLIDTPNADMKNIGGQWAGAITAAQFLQRFVDDTPWAHIDIAGTAMASKKSDINESWGSGFGVRLLDRLVAEHYEG